MTLTAAHVRQACALLKWRSPRLSRQAQISYRSAMNSRKDSDISDVPGTDLWAIRRAFEAAGIRFDNDLDGHLTAILSRADP
jgi:hypothetical protein